MLLKVVQSAALKAPRLVADAVGTFSVITGVVVLFATVELRSVPVVPSVRAETLVTVPVYWSLLVIVKFGYVPVTVVVPAPVRLTVWSGAVLVIVTLPVPADTLMPVPAVA